MPRTLALATALSATLALPAQAMQPGDVDPVIGSNNFAIGQMDGSIASMSLPQGLSLLRGKRAPFRYGVRLDETQMSIPAATAWTQSFCAQFGMQATRHRIAGGGPTARNFKFNCQ